MAVKVRWWSILFLVFLILSCTVLNDTGRNGSGRYTRRPRTKRMYFRRRIEYYSNATSTFQVQSCLYGISTLLLCMDIHPNPGPVAHNVGDNSDQHQRKQTVSAFFQNTQSICNKLSDFHKFVSDRQFDILGLTETWLRDCVLDSEIIDEDFYNLYRRDRSETSFDKDIGGGVCIAIKSEFHSRRCKEFKTSREIRWTEVKLVDRKLFVCSVYMPPDRIGICINDFHDSLQRVCLACESKDLFLIYGDFNLRDLKWDYSVDGGARSVAWTSCHSQRFFDIMDEFQLKQQNYFPTHKGNVLDLVLTNFPLSFLGLHENAVFSHHAALAIDFHVPKPVRVVNSSKTVFNYRKADFDHLRNLLSRYPWSRLQYIADVDEYVEFFYEYLYSAIRESVPVVRIRNKTFPNWYDNDLICAVKEKERARRQYKRTKHPDDYYAFSQARTLFKALRDCKYVGYVAETEDSGHNDSKRFWSFIKTKFKRTSIPSTVSYRDRTASTPSEKADLFNNYFKTVYVSDNPIDPIPEFEHVINYLISPLQINVLDVNEILLSIDPRKSCGPDNISGIVLRECANELALPLSIIFQKSVDSGVFPTLFKQASIVPLFKNGDRSIVENYRSVALLPLFSKVMERILHKHILNHVRPFMSEHQHGFYPGRSTATNLLTHVDVISRVIDDKKQLDCVYIDFSKAFDTINHRFLIHKLKSYGIGSNLLNLVQSYLTDRTQKVVISGCCSPSSYVPSGVPQGSIIGPLLFDIYVNDVCDVPTHSVPLIYADDTKLSREIITLQDCVLLQNDLDSFYRWCVAWKLLVNVIKTMVISFSTKRNHVQYNDQLNGHSLRRVTEIKDLGVTLSADLSFTIHVNNICSQAYRMLGLIKRSCKDFQSVESLQTLYVSLVRSKLEYCSQVWSPNTKLLQKKIEDIQVSFIKYLCFKSGIDYKQIGYANACATFNLPSPESRRRFLDLTFLHGVINNRFDCPALLSQIPFFAPARVLRNITLFRIPKCRVNIRKCSHFPRTLDLCNQFLAESSCDITASRMCFRRKVASFFF
ncbi:hypothetical protein GJAV_G00092740 [Gymnothorax javanicus]|nr:hypothetical protein GJAV_G00092740 [Gymnothorax javanicus]